MKWEPFSKNRLKVLLGWEWGDSGRHVWGRHGGMTCRPRGKGKMWDLLLKRYEFPDPAIRGWNQAWSPCIGCVPMRLPLLWGLENKSHWWSSNEPKDEKYETWPEPLSKLKSFCLSQLCHPKAWYSYLGCCLGLGPYSSPTSLPMKTMTPKLELFFWTRWKSPYVANLFTPTHCKRYLFKEKEWCHLESTSWVPRELGFGCHWHVSWQLYSNSPFQFKCCKGVYYTK